MIMSGPIVRKYGFANFEKIFGERPLQHGVDDDMQPSEDQAGKASPAKPKKKSTPKAKSSEPKKKA
jgi:hypothetical protein